MSRLFFMALSAATIIATPAYANDSTAALGAGGLTLSESADIRMASEDLFISREEVRVAYSFVNESGDPITTRVAFPLPDADMADLGESDTNWPTDNPANVLNFVVKVDGREVHPQLEHEAFFKGEDVTELLRRLGAPLGYPQHGFAEKLMALSPAAKKELTSRGLADFIGDYPHAFWTAKETFHWQQTFPSDRPLRVEHTYKPVVGGSFLASNEFPQSYRKSGFFQNFCIDGGTESAISRMLKAAGKQTGGSGLLMSWYVDYVLTTGRNWKGPIGDFRLTIDKGKPENIVSFCANGVHKTGPTTFTVHMTNFEPEKDLHVIIVEPMPPEANQ
jgi:hypothetical protein